jgi:hypothetical protein
MPRGASTVAVLHTQEIADNPHLLASLSRRDVQWVWSILWSRLNSMEIVQIVLDRKLLQATDRAAQRMKRNRSALVRDALREHLRRLEVREREERDRQGYSKRPQTAEESLTWEAQPVWPAE